MNELQLKCIYCNKEGAEKEFENEYGIKNCSWCNSDNGLIEVENS